MIQNHHTVTLVTLLEFGFSAQMDNLSEIKVTMTFLSFFFPLLTPRHFQIIPTLNRTKYRWGRKRDNWGGNGWLWNHKPALWQLDPGLRSFLHTLKWNTLLLKSRSATLKPPAKLWASEGRERERDAFTDCSPVSHSPAPMLPISAKIQYTMMTPPQLLPIVSAVFSASRACVRALALTCFVRKRAAEGGDGQTGREEGVEDDDGGKMSDDASYW